ncbi:hypothetical protein J4Q44_G00276370, partial [Coregonus suidteri]
KDFNCNYRYIEASALSTTRLFRRTRASVNRWKAFSRDGMSREEPKEDRQSNTQSAAATIFLTVALSSTKMMSSSLCSARLGWILSFWAASRTCCPDTVIGSTRDDISVLITSSSVASDRLGRERKN